MTNFEEYIRQGEPDKIVKSGIWQAAIGLQQVDGLTPSAYLIETAIENIEGRITIDEVQYRIDNYYKSKSVKTDEDDRTEEADTVSARIAKILSNDTFSFSPVEYIAIHRQLFTGIYKHAGKIRDYNITKAEWVLDGRTVLYANAPDIRATLDYDFEREKQYDYRNADIHTSIRHIVKFISGLWQIHAFGEGNTRTTAVFAIKYLRSFGFNVDNTLFEEHSWYFRNALVRANYNDLPRNIRASPEYLMLFFGNLLLGEKNTLKNRELHINWTGNKASDTVSNTTTPDTVNDTVFELIKSNPNITAEEIKVELNISIATAKRRIKALKDAGKIERVGSDKTGHWAVKFDR